MNRRPAAPDQGQNPPDDAAKETTIAIAGLRWRLRRRGALEHPEVLSELRKLELDLITQIESSGTAPGRHRSPGSRARAKGADSPLVLKPDPGRARSAGEFMTALRQFRAWSGGATFRTIAARAGQLRVHSTIWTAMSGDALPNLDVVRAIITGCGGTNEDLEAFTDAWHRINAAAPGNPAAGLDFHAAPVAELCLVRNG